MKAYIVSEHVEDGESSGAQVDELTIAQDFATGELAYVCPTCGEPIEDGQLVVFYDVETAAQASEPGHARCTRYGFDSLILGILPEDDIVLALTLRNAINETLLRE